MRTHGYNVIVCGEGAGGEEVEVEEDIERINGKEEGKELVSNHSVLGPYRGQKRSQASKVIRLVLTIPVGCSLEGWTLL